MLWLYLSLATALATAAQDSWVKHKFSDCTTAEMLSFPMLYSLPFIAVSLFFVAVPPLDQTFWYCFLISIPLNGIAFFLHIRAIQISPLSLTLPYLSFTPVFMFVTGFLLLNELPNVWGVAGVCVITLGSYILNINPATYTPLEPLRALLKEKGSLLMLLVAVMYSLASVLGKKAILHSSVMFFTLTFFLALNICTLVFVRISRIGNIKTLLSRPRFGTIAGLLLFLHLFCHGWAISMTKAVYMISVKRMSILFGVIFGGLFFSEKQLNYRLIGAGLMVAGAATISLKGL